MRTVLDICSGGGGEALGLELAGFTTIGAVENDKAACATLRLNRPSLRVVEADVRCTRGADFRGVDLLAGGVPCPPFSVAGKQQGAGDERDLFPEALRLISEAHPAAVMLENVPGFAAKKFDSYRGMLIERLSRQGYTVDWRILNASAFGVPQLRPRFILIALRQPYAAAFHYPFDPTRVVRLALGHIVDKSKGGADTPDNLRAVCNNCNEGLQNVAPPLPDRIHLLAQIRRATIDDQRAILEWLERKFRRNQT